MRCSVSAKRERCTAGLEPPKAGRMTGDVCRRRIDATSCGARGFMRFQGLIPLAVPVLQRTAPLRSALRPGHESIFAQYGNRALTQTPHSADLSLRCAGGRNAAQPITCTVTVICNFQRSSSQRIDRCKWWLRGLVRCRITKLRNYGDRITTLREITDITVTVHLFYPSPPRPCCRMLRLGGLLSALSP
jgi:hypothetical protein